MKKSKISPTYDHLARMSIDMIPYFEHMEQRHAGVTVSYKVPFKEMTPHQWWVLGKIMSELKLNNCLWYCDPEFKRSSTVKASLRYLEAQTIIRRTETPNVYCVDPCFVRSGSILSVLTSTAFLIQAVPKVSQEHALINLDSVQSLYL